MRLLRLLSNWVLKSHKSRDCAACFSAGLSSWESIFSLYPIWVPLFGISVHHKEHHPPPADPGRLLLGAPQPPPSRPQAEQAAFLRQLLIEWVLHHAGILVSLHEAWGIIGSHNPLAVLIQPGCSWLLLFKVSIAELFPAEMLSLFYSVILEKRIPFKTLCAIVWEEGGVWQSHKGNWRSKRLFCIFLKLFSN